MSAEQADKDTLRVQLIELNNRGRQYGGQTWQVPFAYVGIVGVVLAQIVDKGPDVIRLISLCGFVFGLLVLWHLSSMADGSKRAVLNIQDVEARLHLTPTAQHKPLWYLGPLAGVVVLVMAVCATLLWKPGERPPNNEMQRTRPAQAMQAMEPRR